MKTREDAQRTGCNVMALGCLPGIVVLIVLAVIEGQQHGRHDLVTQVLTAGFWASVLVFLYGGWVRAVVAAAKPTAVDVAQREIARDREKRLATEKVAEDARRKEEQAQRAAERMLQEQKKAEEERRKLEQAERNRLNLLNARSAPGRVVNSGERSKT